MNFSTISPRNLDVGQTLQIGKVQPKMTKPKAADWCTDGVWVGRLQNRWFLTERYAGAGICMHLQQRLCMYNFVETISSTVLAMPDA